MKKIILIISSIIIVAVLGLVAFFGGRTIYDTGVNDGKQDEANSISDKLKALGSAVFEKENFQKELNKIFSDLPSEIDDEGIDSYIEKLTSLIDGISTEKVKSLLKEYLSKWENFKEVYDSEDNNEITENFNQLKTKAEELSDEVKTLFDESIEESLEEL
ncbi:hypothetical protein IJH24_03920 [Candidatus Saccharibacteria bacterium]|nr:hypothetical protein [Candidatus Saccharibacteria bacterium]